MTHADLWVLLRLLEEADTYGRRSVVVDSPPGAGKTLLIEEMAAEMAKAGFSIAVAMPGHEQCLAFVRRFRASNPEVAVQLWTARDRPLPSNLSRMAQRRENGFYWLGPEAGPSIQVGTISKVGTLKDVFGLLDFCFVDEAYQVTFSGYEPLLDRAHHHVFVGDPGQLAPTVRTDTAAFETLRFRPHLPAPVEMARLDPGARRLRLRQTHRFPEDSAMLLQAFYPRLQFSSALSAAERRVQFRRPALHGDGIDEALDQVAMGASLVAITLPASSNPTGRPDWELLALVAETINRLVTRQALLPDGTLVGGPDVGCVEPHVANGEAIRRQLAMMMGGAGAVTVATPEVWQGLQRPFIVTRYPVTDSPSAFDVDPGRLCVATSRHQFGCIVVGRGNVEALLETFHPDVGQRPLGAPDRTWAGVRAHLAFWQQLRTQGRVFEQRA